ncbi:hypothetical protein [Cohnella herbarum]|uniref:Uncharacterized protein n=1 Tax=Cohnella herbarum TaxID=2728023 RepID=A0A7Z2ZKN9_9BACL|nr:hypothetical protein [Cohnella herbarum]QJD83045.1 hypothetical protein HH215_07575 [Cohnella herbarum]
MGAKFVKLLGLIVGVAVVNIVVLSPGLIGVTFGENALATASGVTLLFASTFAVLYGSYALLFKSSVALPVKQLQTHEDFVQAIVRYKHVKSFREDISLALEQLERMRKKQLTLFQVLNQRFEPNELSYKKFASVVLTVEKLFYMNVRSVLNRFSVFDESELEGAWRRDPERLSSKLQQEKANMHNEHLAFVKSSLDANEEMLLKLDKLLMEISRLDGLDPGEIENMPGMQEIDSLIKQTKYYKQ